MMGGWNLYTFTTVVCLAVVAAVALMLVLSIRGKLRLRKGTSTLLINLGVFLALVVLFLPIDGSPTKTMRSGADASSGIAGSIYQAFQVYGGNKDMSTVLPVDAEEEADDTGDAEETGDVEDDLHDAPWRTIRSVLISILFVTAPLMTVSYLIDKINDLFAYVRFALVRKRILLLFYNLNGESVGIARCLSAREGFQGAAVAFGNVNARDDEASELALQAQELGAILFRKSLATNRMIYSRRRATHIFLTDASEQANVGTALALAKTYSDWQNLHIYLSSFRDMTGRLLDSALLGLNARVHMRRIDRPTMLAYTLLDRQPLFLGLRDGDRVLSVLILGAGSIGKAFMKAVLWCGQMDNVRLELSVLDKDAESARDAMWLDCPDIMLNCAVDEQSPGSEAEYSIRFISADWRSKEASDFLETHPRVSYVLVAFGDDDVNAEASVALRARLMRGALRNKVPYPIINTIVEDTEKRLALSQLANDKDSPCHIHACGGNDESLALQLLHGSYYDRLAFYTCKSYSVLNNKEDPEKAPEEKTDKPDPGKAAEEKIDKSEYERHSSLAFGLHIKYKMYDAHLTGAAGWDWRVNPTDGAIGALEAYLQDPAEKERLAILEHRRWNAYVRTEGFVLAEPDEYQALYGEGAPDKLDKRVQMHAALVPWEELDDVSEAVRHVSGRDVDNKKYDRAIILAMPDILKGARDDAAGNTTCEYGAYGGGKE